MYRVMYVMPYTLKLYIDNIYLYSYHVNNENFIACLSKNKSVLLIDAQCTSRLIRSSKKEHTSSLKIDFLLLLFSCRCSCGHFLSIKPQFRLLSIIKKSQIIKNVLTFSFPKFLSNVNIHPYRYYLDYAEGLTNIINNIIRKNE